MNIKDKIKIFSGDSQNIYLEVLKINKEDIEVRVLIYFEHKKEPKVGNELRLTEHEINLFKL